MKNGFRIEVWCSEPVANAIKQLAEHQLTTESNIGRQAFQFFLESIGALKPRSNGRREAMQGEANA